MQLKSQIDAPSRQDAESLEREVIAERLAKKAPKPVKKTKTRDPVWDSVRKIKIDSGSLLTLTELIDLGLRNNPSTRQEWENTRVARAKEKQAESKLYPQLTISGNLTREKKVAIIPTSNMNDLHYGPSAKITYLLLDFGGRSANIEQTVQEILAADSQYNQAIQDLLRDVEKYYYQLHSAQSGQEAAEDDVKNTKADFEAAQEKFNAGLVAKLEVLQAKSDYEDSLYTLEDAKGKVQTAKANLAQAVGIPADTKFQIAIPAKPLPTDIDEEDITSIIEDALTRRPDIIALRRETKAKESAVKAVVSDLLPSLNLGATAGANQYKYYSNAKTKKQDSEYSVYASVDWDIFDGFYNLNRKVEAERQLDIAKDKLMQKELAVSADVWIRFYDFNTAVSKLTYSESFLNTAQTSYELAFESYRCGLKSILDLLQAESKLSEARSRFIQSKEDVFVALAELAHAKGSLNNVKAIE